MRTFSRLGLLLASLAVAAVAPPAAQAQTPGGATGGAPEAEAGPGLRFNGLGRSYIQQSDLGGTVAETDTTTAENLADGNFVLDLAVNAQPNRVTEVQGTLRLRNEFGGFFGAGATVEIRELWGARRDRQPRPLPAGRHEPGAYAVHVVPPRRGRPGQRARGVRPPARGHRVRGVLHRLQRAPAAGRHRRLRARLLPSRRGARHPAVRRSASRDRLRRPADAADQRREHRCHLGPVRPAGLARQRRRQPVLRLGRPGVRRRQHRHPQRGLLLRHRRDAA